LMYCVQMYVCMYVCMFLCFFFQLPINPITGMEVGKIFKKLGICLTV
jgi:hypothetical protein